MKLFLTSSGFSETNESEFVKLLGRDPQGLRAAFIPTASGQDDQEMRSFYLAKEQESITRLGMTYKVVNLEKQNPNFIVELFKSYDIIYVSGGNTFFLMKEIIRSGFKEHAHEILKDKVYVGVSAGSIVVGPDIDLAGWEPGDENNVGLKDTKGLGLVDFCIMPHWDGRGYREASGYPHEVRYIKDEEAVSVSTMKNIFI